MNSTVQQQPDYIFEASWEVCNKVGGIYTVLSTKANQMELLHPQKVFYIGPDIWKGAVPVDFIPIHGTELNKWAQYAHDQEELFVRVGYWDVPGKPYAILVDYLPFMQQRNSIYGDVWDWFKVDSLHAYGDYHDASMFGYASGEVIASFYNFFKLNNKAVVAHFHEWMTSFGLFYCRHFLPHVATIFTTHATSIGRSIAGNGKPLYGELQHYNGDQMASELNMEAKHSAEKQAAHHAHCFTTVSDITAKECKQLLDKAVDLVTPNGFEDSFVPKGAVKRRKRMVARKALLSIAQSVVGSEISPEAMIVAISGRYEFKNKGIDLFIDTMNVLRHRSLQNQVVAFLLVPAWISGPRMDLLTNKATNVDDRFTTHLLREPQNDPVLHKIFELGFDNAPDSKLKIVFVPSYLAGNDGVFNLPYYDVLAGCDLTLFPSYYEPWGYTPMESAAFGIPTITTDLAGFGQWVSAVPQSIQQGIAVLHRSDYDESILVTQLADNVQFLLEANHTKRQQMGRKAFFKSQQALWQTFIEYYEQAYHLALEKCNEQTRTVEPIS